MNSDTSYIPPTTITPCGATAYFDEGSGIGYRCEECMAFIGSIGMPRECKDLMEMDKIVDKLRKTK